MNSSSDSSTPNRLTSNDPAFPPFWAHQTTFPIHHQGAVYRPGTENDEDAAFELLKELAPGYDREMFLGALTEPGYRPERRLVVEWAGRVVSQLTMIPRRLIIGAARVACQDIRGVGTLPEYRGRGYAQNLVRLAEALARRRPDAQRPATPAGGSVVTPSPAVWKSTGSHPLGSSLPIASAGLLTIATTMPAFFQALGWTPVGRPRALAIPSRILPAIADAPLERHEVDPDRPESWRVRPWRQVELLDLMRLYQIQFGSTTGALERSEEHWRWLVSRRLAHAVLVACVGDEVGGYVFIKDHRVLEIAHNPARPSALTALLGRVRAEALERAYPVVALFAPENHPARRLVVEPSASSLSRGGPPSWTAFDPADPDEIVAMVRVVDPVRLLLDLLPELEQRHLADHPGEPLELGFQVESRKALVKLGTEPGQARIELDRVGRRRFQLSAPSFTQLVLGGVEDPAALIAADSTSSASGRSAVEAARRLFPPQPFWRGPLDLAER